MLFQILKTKIKVCSICFKNIHDLNFHQLWHKNLCVCQKCQDNFHTLFSEYKIDNVRGLAIYEYNEFFQENLYKLKACNDVEIAPAFLSYHLPYLRIRFRNYCLIPAPSHISHDQQRGFNHVKEIFQTVGKEFCPAIIKTQDRKQSDLSALERQKISEILRWDETIDITNKKILFVDDVFTTGATIKACLGLIKKHNPKSVSILVLSKVINKGER